MKISEKHTAHARKIHSQSQEHICIKHCLVQINRFAITAMAQHNDNSVSDKKRIVVVLYNVMVYNTY